MLPETLGRLRQVHVSTRNVFAAEEAEDNLLYRLANALHWPTEHSVVAREVWLVPGQPVSPQEIAELERHLRAFGIYGAATVTARPVPGAADPGEVDLFVDTRDRFTLGASGSYSSVGGVEKINVQLSESNLFGTGKQVAVNYSSEDEDTASSLRWSDPQFLGSWHQLEATIGDADTGAFGGLSLVRPFHHRLDDRSHGAIYSGADTEARYYSSGQEVAAAPVLRHDVRLFGALREGGYRVRRALGLDLRLSRRSYEPATGPLAATIDVPGDTDTVQLGPYFTFDLEDRYEEVTGLDSLGFVEDLTLGSSLRVQPGVQLRDEEGAGSRADAVLGATFRWAVEPVDRTYLTLAAGGDVRFHEDDLRGYRGAFAVHLFNQSLPRQTLAASYAFDLIGDEDGLPPQLTLGEDNGLRGYPAREFAGTRIGRLNLEDRFDTGLELWSVHLGLVGFLDLGWVDDPVTGDDPIRSWGVGLRFGSTNLLGRRVLRVDFAWPLDDFAGEDYGMSISVTTGQVFTFFGNASELSRSF